MCAYQVTVAVGDARRHDTGQRIDINVIAPSKSDAALIAESLAEFRIEPTQYAYAKRVRPVGGRPPAMAMALAA